MNHRSFLNFVLVFSLFNLVLPGTANADTLKEVEKKTPVKVMIIAMFKPEADAWLKHFSNPDLVRINGLSPDYPDVYCEKNGLCLTTTGMGKSNAASSVMALAFSDKLDLTKTYFIISGIAGINPRKGALGSTAWANYLVDVGIQWEIDARQKPKDWPSGFLGINTKNPNEKPKLDYKTELFELNPRLVDLAYSLTKNVTLTYSKQMQAYGEKYGYAPANLAPKVLQCDTATSDTWWEGSLIAERVEFYTKQLTEGKGDYCTSQQEDNATYEALKRASVSERVDLNRVLVLRAGSDFDRQPKGVSAADNLVDYQNQGAFGAAVDNLYLTGKPLVDEIINRWSIWGNGIPSTSH